MAVLSDAQREAGWTIAKLGDIATLVMGTSPKSSDVVDYPLGIPLLNGPAEFTDKYPVPVKWTEKGIRFSEPGDILFCVRATLGKMNFSDRQYAIGRGLAAIRGIDELHTRYIYYTLLSTMESILRNANGTIYLSVTKSDVENFEIPLPPKDTLKRIAGILGSLDDKIEANTRLIQTIKEYMTALYKAEAKNGKVLELTDIADFVNGRAFTKDATGTGRVVIRIAELNNGLGASTVYNDIEVKEENTAYPGDVLMSWSGSLDTYVWHLPEAIINQHIFKVIPKGNYPKWLVYHACKSVIEDFQAIAVDKATTMGHIRRGDLKRDISIPAQEMPQMENLWNLWMNLEQENLQLAETRDALIKRLID